MKVNVKELKGNWKKGYALDKHTIKSIPIGYNQYGYLDFDTTRSEAGEALYQLKYKYDWSQSDIISKALFEDIIPKFPDNIGLIVPAPPSKKRQRQPVFEIASSLARMMKINSFENILIKTNNTSQLKEVSDKAEKVELLKDKFSINDSITNEGKWNALLIDDLYDTGATLETAYEALKSYRKINNIYVATVTWK